MTDTPNRSTATTARRPDCVTEIRRQDDESAGSRKRSRTQADLQRMTTRR